MLSALPQDLGLPKKPWGPPPSWPLTGTSPNHFCLGEKQQPQQCPMPAWPGQHRTKTLAPTPCRHFGHGSHPATLPCLPAPLGEVAGPRRTRTTLRHLHCFLLRLLQQGLVHFTTLPGCWARRSQGELRPAALSCEPMHLCAALGSGPLGPRTVVPGRSYCHAPALCPSQPSPPCAHPLQAGSSAPALQAQPCSPAWGQPTSQHTLAPLAQTHPAPARHLPAPAQASGAPRPSLGPRTKHTRPQLAGHTAPFIQRLPCRPRQPQSYRDAGLPGACQKGSSPSLRTARLSASKYARRA